MQIPSELIPKSPDDGSDVVMNLRSDDTFVEDEGWHRASAAYADYLKKHENDHVLYLELGVGLNTPVIIKYPFWQMTLANDKATYACLNDSEAYCPEEIAVQSVCIDGDIGDILDEFEKSAFACRDTFRIAAMSSSGSVSVVCVGERESNELTKCIGQVELDMI